MTRHGSLALFVAMIVIGHAAGSIVLTDGDVWDDSFRMAGTTIHRIAETGSAAARISLHGIERKLYQCPDCNVILMTVEPLQKDHLTPYGYARNTTPALRELAQSSTRHTNAYTSSGHTTIALTSTHTSLYPTQHRVTTRNARERWNSNSFRTLGETLQAAGYRTIAVTDDGNIRAELGFDRGFDVYGGGYSETRWLRTLSTEDRPFFLMVQSFGPHYPYTFPDSYTDLFLNTSNPAREAYADTVERYAEQSQTLQAARNGSTPAACCDPFHTYVTRLERNQSMQQEAVRAYDTRIRAADDRLRQIIATLKQTGDYDETVIIFTAQHGEVLPGDRAWRPEAGAASVNVRGLDETVINIPLLIHIPGTPPQQKVSDAYVQTLDIAPTLLDILDIRNASFRQQAEGISLLPTIAGLPLDKQHIFAANSDDHTAYIDPTTHHKYLRHGETETVIDLSQAVGGKLVADGNARAAIRSRFQAFYSLHRNPSHPPINASYPYYAP